jgi:hypothetical protein
VIQLVISILLGVGLIALLCLFWLRSRACPEGSANALFDAQTALDALKMGTMPGALINRVLAQEDFHFIASATSPAVRSVFVRERKRLALLWVHHVRAQVLDLRRFHFAHSRFYSRLSFRTELGLAFAFSFLLAECRLLQAVIFLRGPYPFPRLLGRTVSAAWRICTASERSTAFLNLSAAKVSRSSGPQNEAAS